MRLGRSDGVLSLYGRGSYEPADEEFPGAGMYMASADGSPEMATHVVMEAPTHGT